MDLLQKRFNGKADGRLRIAAGGYDTDLHRHLASKNGSPGRCSTIIRQEATGGRQTRRLSLRDLYRRAALCPFLGAEDPDQTTKCADQKRYDAEQKRYVDSFVHHQ